MQYYTLFSSRWLKALMLCASLGASITPAMASGGLQNINTNAVLGGAIGGGAGAAVGSAVGGRNGAIIGSAVGAAAGVVIATPEQSRESRRYDNDHEDRGHHYGHRKHHHHDD